MAATTREALLLRSRKVTLSIWPGIFVAMLGHFFAPKNIVFDIVAAVLILGAMLASIIVVIRTRCVRCGAELGPYALVVVAKRQTYDAHCPHCGINMNEAGTI